MDLLKIIKVHGLAIRQMPHVVTSRYTAGNMKPHEGDLLVPVRIGEGEDYDKLKAHYARYPQPIGTPYVVTFDDTTRTITRMHGYSVKEPKHAGWWMCKSVANETGELVRWSLKDNLAPTLEESVALYLAGLK